MTGNEHPNQLIAIPADSPMYCVENYKNYQDRNVKRVFNKMVGLSQYRKCMRTL